jgi:hypothetical protein
MTALSKLEAAGFIVALVDDRLNVTPTRSPLNDTQREYIRQHKTEIITQLSKTKASHSNELLQDIREQIEERAAIMEYDGGLSRHDAELAATKAIRVYCYRVTDKPDRELTVIMPNTELDEAKEKLKYKYGARLIDVYPSPYNMGGMIPSDTKH